MKFLASIYLALILLVVLIAACVVATVIEKDLTFQVVHAYVYSSWWFTLWLLMLGVNVFCAAAVRFPWRRDQFGFVITHAGIIVILFGGLIDRYWGVEGNIRMEEGQPATRRINLPGEELVVQVGGMEKSAFTPFSMALVKRKSDVSFAVASPDPDVKVRAVAIQPVSPSIAGMEPAEDGQPAVRWHFDSAMMGRQPQWLMMNDTVSMGPAIIRFTHGQPPRIPGTAELSFFLDDGGRLCFQRSSKSATSTGRVEVGTPTPLEWGMEAAFVVDQYFPGARPKVLWTPRTGAPPPASSMRENSTFYGVRCQVQVGGLSEFVWVGPRLASPVSPWQEVTVGDRTVRLRQSNRTAELPFSVQLVKFEAPYHEGLASEERFEKFESLLRFNNEEGREQTASMNHPATYPTSWWRPALGMSYRISQAGHEMPNNPRASIVQVLRDPGWFPKWFGSLMVCGGIFTMFYLTGSRRRPRGDGTTMNVEPNDAAAAAVPVAVAANNPDAEAEP